MKENIFVSQINDKVRKVIDQSSGILASVSTKDKEKLVDEITNEVLLSFNNYINEAIDDIKTEDIVSDSTEKKSVEQLSDEEILWKGRPFLSLTESYIITSERVKLITGFIARKVENFELIRIQDIDYQQNIGERIIGLGDIKIRGHDPSDPSIILRNIPKPEEVYELLRKGWLNARKKHGLQFREYM